MANTVQPVGAELYRIATEQAKDYALLMLDPGGVIITWNAGAERIKGYTAEQIIGRHFSVFYTRESVERGWPAYELKVAAAEGRFEDEGWRVRRDGSQFWASVVITALRDEAGRLLGFSKITRDLTVRRQHEEALRQSEERFRLLIEGVTDYSIFMLDPEGIVTSWNSGAERIKGYRREEIIGKHFSRFYLPEEAAAGRPWEELACARREGRAEDEGWRVKKDGSRFWARVVVNALYDSAGRLQGFAKITQDLTERRHLHDLETATRNLSEFLAILAHELRNPLAPIRTAVQVMQKSPDEAPTQTAMRAMIDRQSAHLERLLDDMLDVARMTRGRLEIEHELVALDDVIRLALETSQPAIEAARHRLRVDSDTRSLIVRGDRDRLAQLLANLLNNAARYTPAGGDITIRLAAEDGHAQVTVRDTGRGIEAGQIDHVFEMFVQGSKTGRRAGEGLGIGLALARRIAELHGGTLTVASAGDGQGSAFTLKVPLAQPPQPASAADAPQPVPASVARGVLMVDHNVAAAVSLRLLLTSLGHEAAAVHDGRQALAAAAGFHPDIVLLDIGLPDIDGYEVARGGCACRRRTRTCRSSRSPAGGRSPTGGSRTRPASTCTWSSRWTRPSWRRSSGAARGRRCIDAGRTGAVRRLALTAASVLIKVISL